MENEGKTIGQIDCAQMSSCYRPALLSQLQNFPAHGKYYFNCPKQWQHEFKVGKIRVNT
jgi:hypothetical protein